MRSDGGAGKATRSHMDGASLLEELDEETDCTGEVDSSHNPE